MLRKSLYLCVLIILAGGYARTDTYVERNVKTSDQTFALQLGRLSTDTDFGSLRHSWLMGWLYDYRKLDWPLRLVLDGSFSWNSANDGEYSRTLFEIDPGLRYVAVRVPYLKPYMGFGVSAAYAAAELERGSDHGYGMGWWVGGGVMSMVDERLFFDLDVRRSWILMDLSRATGDAATDVGGLIMTLGFGSRW